MSENIYKEAEENFLDEKFNKLLPEERHFIVEKVLSSRVNIKAYYEYLNDADKFDRTISRLDTVKEEKKKEATLHKSAEKLQETMTEQGFEVTFEQALNSIMSLTSGKKATESTVNKSKENKKFDLQIGDVMFANKGMGGQGDQSAILEALQKMNANHTLNDKWMYVVVDQRERLISLVESKSITLKDDNKNKLTVDDIRNHFKIEKLAEKAEETE